MLTLCVRPHLVRLAHVHAAVGVVVHLFVDAADRLEAQQGVLVPAELLVDQTQVCQPETRTSLSCCGYTVRLTTKTAKLAAILVWGSFSLGSAKREGVSRRANCSVTS